jgi:uncharacterized SAM-binding protein YcdF (DUF218 family)
MKHVIIILGGGVNHSGSLPKTAEQRIEKGFELFKQGVAEFIITSGLWGIEEISTHLEAESESMREKLIRFGVPAEKVFSEEKSRDTIENAFFTKRLYLEPNNWNNIVVVTSDFHVCRAEYVFKKILGKNYMMTFETANTELDPDKLMQINNKENKLLAYDKKCLSKIKSGDEKEIKRLLFFHHPLYQSTSKNR